MRLSGRQTLLLGSALRGQRYDDNTSATGLKSEAGTTLKNLPDNRWIPSLFAQLEWLTSESMRLNTGMRMDYQKDHGWIPSPSAKFEDRASDADTSL